MLHIMPTYKGSIDLIARQAILDYGKTLPQKETQYRVLSEEFFEKYHNIDLHDLTIVASNDAEAVVIWLDYLNQVLDLGRHGVHEDQYENVDLENVSVFVRDVFEDSTLGLHKTSTPVVLRLQD